MLRKLLILAALAASVASCSWFDEDEGPPLPGERIPVLEDVQRLEADRRVADITIELPRPAVNREWPQAGGYPSHAMHHLALGENLARAWQADIGKGSSSERKLLVQPVVARGLIFTMDSEAEVRAFQTDGGQRAWSRNVLSEEEEEGDLGGGLAFADGRLYVSTGAGDVIALNPNNGEEIWRAAIGSPIRGAPTVSNGRVFVVTIENILHVLEADNGERDWRHEGLAAEEGILGAASPAVGEGVVIVPQSSGELISLLAENGRQLWIDRLAASRLPSPVSNIADIKASPVIDRGMVFAVSHSGRLAAIQLRSGNRAWDLDIGALETPWVAGDYVFVVTTNGYLGAILRNSGRVRWAINLRRYVDPDDREGHLVWAGPVLAGDRLIVAGSHGEALSVSPYTGEILGWLPLGDGVTIQPVVADSTIYFLNESGRLTAMR